MFFVSNLPSSSQAGHRRFEPVLPIQAGESNPPSKPSTSTRVSRSGGSRVAHRPPLAAGWQAANSAFRV